MADDIEIPTKIPTSKVEWIKFVLTFAKLIKRFIKNLKKDDLLGDIQINAMVDDQNLSFPRDFIF